MLLHYGDFPTRTLQSLESAPTVAFTSEIREIVAKLHEVGLFDGDFYKIRYPDVVDAGFDPLEHYIRHGASEGRNPNLWFDSAFYLKDNPDIAAKITNPLLHYCYAGYQEGRRPNPEVAKRSKRQIMVILADGLPLEDVAYFVANASCQRVDQMVICIRRPDARELSKQRALWTLFEPGAIIRLHGLGQQTAALLEIMSNYQNDALYLAHPLASGSKDFLTALRSAIGDEESVVSLRNAYAAFTDGKLVLERNLSAEARGFAIPLLEYGIFIPPGAVRKLLANAQSYLKYASNFPSIWVAIQALLDGRPIKTAGVSTGRIQPSLDQLGSPNFRAQLQDTLVFFRRELTEKLGFNLLYELFRNELGERYKHHMREDMPWNSPVTYSQKLQHLKLCDDVPLKTLLADKYRMRSYIRQTIGEKYVIPLLGVWKSFDDIDFGKLPDKFVLKTTHASNQNFIVNDKNQFDHENAKKKFQQWLNYPYYQYSCEYNYFDVEPLIICEPMLGDNISDYKVLCFHGKPDCLWVATDRYIDCRFTFFTPEWEKIDVEYGHKMSSTDIPKPANLNLMLQISSKLSKPFIHARVDFFILSDGSLKVGEITFYTYSGFTPAEPRSFDERLGTLIRLNDQIHIQKPSV